MEKRVTKEFEKLKIAYGGIDNYREEIKRYCDEATFAWNSDPIAIGRILRAHLYVEHYLDKYLREEYNLNNKELVFLNFYGKIKKIERNDKIWILCKSLKKLNSIRNKIAHNLSFSFTKNDLIFFKNRKEFQSYWFIIKSSIDENDFLDVYEVFCQFISQNINEALNPKQYLIDNVMEALRKDIVDIWKDSKKVDED
ncbi:hypothetical protein [Aliarcobacter butzleri]|uniref:Uncharacterized protein n=1 Tax=Aliarcobacter butzleri TaxID=28197 RepID=A0AAW6VIT9_9BACT|nr:hypothetical protein [Aliarcobacter butzleri]MDK2042082.1 hypothetical protein [Aliarcobacter butzleri]MDK2097301.1 hypothetical protein [Aliarcobacter butzleri]